ncbi:MAG TPA: TQO small subunit DoxD [Gemmatimonadales bacterium]|nr:TQO small subunit DoxD [Gemmatimonadales bacterium]
MNRRPTVSLDHPEEWIVFLRVVVGLYFVKALWTKLSFALVGGFVPVLVTQERWIDTMPKIVARQASENPILWYKGFLENTVLTHPALFAHLTAWGETAVGLGLVLGLLNGLAAATGMLMVAGYGLATQWMSPGQRGFHIVLFAVMVVFFFARAGRRWGLDAVIATRKPDSMLAGRPWS